MLEKSRINIGAIIALSGWGGVVSIFLLGGREPAMVPESLLWCLDLDDVTKDPEAGS